MSRRVLSVASECVPLVKTGGLADVIGALPAALAGRGYDMRVLMPAYPGIADHLQGGTPVWSDENLFGGPARALGGTVGDLQVLLLDAPHLYDRPGGPYGYGDDDHKDNPERFAALSFAAAQIARTGLVDGWRPHVLHAHDWQAGLAPAYLRYGGDTDVRSVITVHNIAYQGLAPAERLESLRLPPAEFNPGGLEYYGQISALKAGLVTADAITTVSPTYAAELLRREFGMGLEGVLAERASRVHGILNGVDDGVWSPASDPHVTPYSPRSLAGKRTNRAKLIAEFGLADVPGPLIVIVSRLTPQKGIDLVPPTLPELVAKGGGLVVLGSGDPDLEQALRDAEADYPQRVGVRIGYDEPLSHRMFAGGDAVLVPSRFEPCGLTQMYGLRYGTIPVVAATGGLADTVIDANPAALAAGAATGVVFHPTDRLALAHALRRLAALFDDPATWSEMQANGMGAELGWERSSARYAALYDSLKP